MLMDFAHVDLVIFCVYPGVKATVKKISFIILLKMSKLSQVCWTRCDLPVCWTS